MAGKKIVWIPGELGSDLFWLATGYWLTGERLGNRPRRRDAEQLGNKENVQLLSSSMATSELTLHCMVEFDNNKKLGMNSFRLMQRLD